MGRRAALLLLPLLCAAGIASAQPVANNYRIDEAMARPAEARLVWSDEFDGTALDPSRNGATTRPAIARAGIMASSNIMPRAGPRMSASRTGI